MVLTITITCINLLLGFRISAQNETISKLLVGAIKYKKPFQRSELNEIMSVRVPRLHNKITGTMQKIKKNSRLSMSSDLLIHLANGPVEEFEMKVAAENNFP